MTPLKFIKHILTDEEDQWDLGIFLWLFGVGLFFYRTILASAWDPQAYGTGFLGVLGAGAALQWIRTKNKEKP